MADLTELQSHLEVISRRAPSGSRWRHLKTGTIYLVTGHYYLEANCRPAIGYTPLYGAQTFAWVRDAEEFLDGRFERIAKPAPCPECYGFGYWEVEESDERRTCRPCGGTGRQPALDEMDEWDGEGACPKCQGDGCDPEGGCVHDD